MVLQHWVDPATLGLSDDDWTRNAGLMFPSNLTDDVGIGLNNPSYRFHVDGGTIPFRVDVASTEVMRLNDRTLEFLNSNDNTLIGENAGIGLATGFSNTLVGSNAGPNIGIGAYNTGVGHLAMSTLTTGSRNTAVGYNSLSEYIFWKWQCSRG